jgi:hypothetical protein
MSIKSTRGRNAKGHKITGLQYLGVCVWVCVCVVYVIVCTMWAKCQGA